MMKLRTIIDRALLVADEVGSNTTGYATSGFDNEDRIAAFIESALRWVLLHAPVRLLTPRFLYGNIDAQADGSGYIELPSDYLRLCTLRMEGWRTELHEVLPATHPLAALQLSAATRALPSAPLCFYATTPSGAAAIHYYGASREGEHEIRIGTYQADISIDTTDSDSEIELNSQLLDAVAYKCVAAFFASIERSDLMQLCEAQAVAALPTL